MKIHQLLDKVTPTIKDLANKYQVSVREVHQQLITGTGVEMEHTNDPKLAREIALDHLGERLDYYQLLAQIETPTQESTTRTSARGAPGTLKAKISGKVTCAKVNKLKNRTNATPHDKAQANWFINMHDCNEHIQEIFNQPSSHIAWRKFPYGMWEANFNYQGHNVVVEMNEDKNQDYARFVFHQNYLDLPEQYTGYNIIFRVDKQTDVSGQWGVQSVGLISRVLQVVVSFLENNNWDYVVFSGQQGSRNKLYAAMSEKLARKYNLKIATSFDDFVVYKPYESLNEVFGGAPKAAEWRHYPKFDGWETNFNYQGNNVVIQMRKDAGQAAAKWVFGGNDKDLPADYVGYDLIFSVNGKTNRTDQFGTDSVNLIAKVIQIALGFLQTHEWDYVTFWGAGGSRNKLYRAISDKLAQQYDLDVLTHYNDFVVYKPVQDLQEAFDWRLPKNDWEIIEKGDNYITIDFTVEDHPYVLELTEWKKNTGIYDVVFASIEADDPTGITGSGQAFKVFSAVKQLIDQARLRLTTRPMTGLVFTAKGASRQKLYTKLAPLLAQEYGWKFTNDPKMMPYNPNPEFKKGYLIYDPKALKEAAGVGLVVPGVNMPAGMHRNEIQRQAKKFGFKVSAQGVPPLIYNK